jgi:branched-chain amino acid transport system ATP-binding protein
MLLVEQDVGFAFRCSDRAVVLEHGQVAREGPTAQIAADPYVKQAYLGVA